MRFGKQTMFLFLNGLIALGLLLYFGVWILGNTVTGTITTPYESTRIVVNYEVDGTTYTGTYLRGDVAYGKRKVAIRYLNFDPSASRINSFLGIFAEPLAWWLVFLIASAMLLLTDNMVFSKGTIFQLQKKFPWISMDEYYRLPWWYRSREKTEDPPELKEIEN